MASCKFPKNFDENPEYGVNWARNVYQELCEKYPRATNLVRELFSLTDSEWISFLVKRDNMWTGLRNLVHILDVRIKNNWADGLTRDALIRWMSRYDVYFLDKKCEERALTRLKKISILEEQDVKGGSREVKEPKATKRRGNQPSPRHSIHSIPALPGQLELFNAEDHAQPGVQRSQEEVSRMGSEA